MVNNQEKQAIEAIRQARAALKAGQKKVAYSWAKRAAKLTPDLEDSWLILAAVSKPESSIKFLRQALRINPNSQRAKKGMAWAERKLSPQGKQVQNTSAKRQAIQKKEEEKPTSFIFDWRLPAHLHCRDNIFSAQYHPCDGSF